MPKEGEAQHGDGEHQRLHRPGGFLCQAFLADEQQPQQRRDQGKVHRKTDKARNILPVGRHYRHKAQPDRQRPDPEHCPQQQRAGMIGLIGD